MPRTEQPGVPTAIALSDVDSGSETLRALDERVDAPALRDIIAVLCRWNVDRFPASNPIEIMSAMQTGMSPGWPIWYARSFRHPAGRHGSHEHTTILPCFHIEWSRKCC